ncbi:MAG: dTMP kinase [Halobacteriota archaeon]
MKPRLNRGVLVAIEGIDGVGKTTQSMRLVDRLRALEFDTVRFFEPTQETQEAVLIGQKLQQSTPGASSEILELFLVDRRHDVEEHIMPALSEKKIVVMDRYFLSTAAYQSDSLSWQEILDINREIAPEPDITFIINWPAATAISLIKARNKGVTAFENERALLLIRERYLEIAREDFGNYVVVERIADEEDICDEILDSLLKYLHERGLVEYNI